MKQQYRRCSCHDLLILATMVIATAAAAAAAFAWAPLLQSSHIELRRPEDHHHQRQQRHLYPPQQQRRNSNNKNNKNNNDKVKGVHALFANKRSDDNDAQSPNATKKTTSKGKLLLPRR